MSLGMLITSIHYKYENHLHEYENHLHEYENHLHEYENHLHEYEYSTAHGLFTKIGQIQTIFNRMIILYRKCMV